MPIDPGMLATAVQSLTGGAAGGMQALPNMGVPVQAPVMAPPDPLAGVPEREPVAREVPDVDPARAALLERWCRRMRAAKEFHKAAFKRMREDMVFARLGSTKEWADAGNYTAPIVKRHINQAVAALYARNPKATARARQQLMNTVWDGKVDSLQRAMEGMMAASQPPQPGMPPVQIDPQAPAIIDEAGKAQERAKLLDGMTKTVEILYQYFVDEQEPAFKRSLKQLVRRVKTCGVGYVKLGFQRLLEPSLEMSQRIADATSEIVRLETLMADAADGETNEGDAEIEEARLLLQNLQEREFVIAREGPMFDFPRATEVLVDPKCRHVGGFVGADWIAHEYMRTPDDIEDIYRVDIRSGFKPYDRAPGEDRRDYAEDGTGARHDGSMACVWEVQHKKNGEVFVICDGYPDYLVEPHEPDVKVEGFWTIGALTFNDIEDECEIFPPSDVHDLKHIQNEYNRAGQGLREHRRASTPKFGVGKGMLSDEDAALLGGSAPFSVLQLNLLADGSKIEDKLQQLRGTPIDPALYDKEGFFTDLMRSVGGQEANLGGVSGATATESSIADASLSKAQSSNVDDLDDLLSWLAKATTQLMLLELQEETVKSIVGPGAVWPQESREQVVRDLYMHIQAGSSGRPNEAAEIAKLERAMPTVIQLGGVNPKPLVRKYEQLLGFDPDELDMEGLPSIVSMNAQATAAASQPQPGTGDPASDPASQGPAGGQNAPQQPQGEPGGQPAYPSGPPGM